MDFRFSQKVNNNINVQGYRDLEQTNVCQEGKSIF